MNSCPLLLGLLALHAAPPPAPAPPARPADSVVKVISTVRIPNPIRPWVRPKSQEFVGSGVVIDGDRILTNAHVVEYATEVFVQVRSGEDRIEAKVVSVGPDVDLAVLTVKDKAFFEKRPPLPPKSPRPNPPHPRGARRGASRDRSDARLPARERVRLRRGSARPGLDRAARRGRARGRELAVLPRRAEARPLKTTDRGRHVTGAGAPVHALPTTSRQRGDDSRTAAGRASVRPLAFAGAAAPRTHPSGCVNSSCSTA